MSTVTDHAIFQDKLLKSTPASRPISVGTQPTTWSQLACDNAQLNQDAVLGLDGNNKLVVLTPPCAQANPTVFRLLSSEKSTLKPEPKTNIATKLSTKKNLVHEPLARPGQNGPNGPNVATS